MRHTDSVICSISYSNHIPSTKKFTSRTQNTFYEKYQGKYQKTVLENVYSNIPHELGIEAFAFWLDKYLTELPSKISKGFVLDGLKVILENNSFCFNDTYFVQTKGTAMRTKVDPIYTSLVLAYLVEKMYVQSKKSSIQILEHI